jgi:RNA polymerase sigma-70 factor, ECF subfamily
MNPDETKQTIRDLYERYSALVFRHCRFILHSDDEAWDATQEVFLKLIAGLSGIKKHTSMYSWLLSVSTNHCISMLRRKKSEEFDENIHSTESTHASQDRRLILKDILNRLMRPWNKKIREVVIYTYFDEYSQKEISQLTGLGESTIRKYLTQFRRGSRYALTEFSDALEA